MLARTFAISFTHKADKLAEEGDIDGIDKSTYRISNVCINKGCTSIFGSLLWSRFCTNLFGYIPEFIMKGLTVAGGILPALGFGMLLSLMLNKKLWVFLLVGFVCTIYGNIPTIGLAMIGIIFAVLYDIFTNSKKDSASTVEASANAQVNDEGGYDL